MKKWFNISNNEYKKLEYINELVEREDTKRALEVIKQK